MPKPVPTEDVLTRRLDEERVLVHVGTGRIYSLNDTGARYWELLAEGRDREEIETVLREEFVVDRKTLRRELDRLEAELVDAGLLEVSEGA